MTPVEHAQLRAQRSAAHRKAIEFARDRIVTLEAQLSRADAQRVVAVEVPGYNEPPERVARAVAEHAAGIRTVLTPEDVAGIKAGTRPQPTFVGPAYHEITRAKREIVSLRQRIAASQDALSGS